MRKRESRGRGLPVCKGGFDQVRVRRERPAAPAWAVALAITMLMVYLVTILPGKDMQAESAFAGPGITREIDFESIDMYLVSMCSCASGEEARLLASGYTGRGAAGYAYEDETGWHVLGAAYGEARDAVRIAERLKAQEGLEAGVIRLSAPKVNMRITAPEIQIDAIAEADELLRGHTAQLGDMARQLDRGEISPGVVSTLCAVAATRAEACAEILKMIPDAGNAGLCKSLAGMLNSLNRLMDAVAASDERDTAVLSGMLRCAQIDVLTGLAALQRELAAQ